MCYKNVNKCIVIGTTNHLTLTVGNIHINSIRKKKTPFHSSKVRGAG